MGARSVFCVAAAALVACVGGALRSPAAVGGEAPPKAAPAAPEAAHPANGAAPSHAAKPPDPDDPGPDADYAGRALCGGPRCHGAGMAEFDTLRHSHYVSDPKYKDAAGCELCHGPATNHIGDPEHRHIYRFTVQSPENARRIDEACLKCHQETLSRPHFQATEHARVGISCAGCHEVHYDLKTPYLLRFPGVNGPAGQPGRDRLARLPASHPAVPAAREPSLSGGGGTSAPAPASPPPVVGTPGPAAEGVPEAAVGPVNRPKLEMVAKTRVPIPNWRTSFSRQPGAVTEEQAVNEMCLSCHRRQVSELRQFSHHPAPEGRVSCVDCHDAHVESQRAGRGAMLKRGTVEETCLQCHPQRRGPFIFEHDPVRAGGVGDNCLECHKPHGSPNRKLEALFSRGLCLQCHTDIAQDPPHRSRPGDCWRSGCHTAIHGSNHSGLLFTE
jgi:predicted CXXCH cytochrome family protein